MIPQILYCYRFNPTSLTSHYKGDEYQKAVALYQKVCFWSEQAQDQLCKEFRRERFFLTKVRELLFRLSASTMPYKEKVDICNSILQDTTLQTVLHDYPIKRYQMKYRVPAYLMKLKSSVGVLLLYPSESKNAPHSEIEL